jgi:hypothetical protein
MSIMSAEHSRFYSISTSNSIHCFTFSNLYSNLVVMVHSCKNHVFFPSELLPDVRLHTIYTIPEEMHCNLILCEMDRSRWEADTTFLLRREWPQHWPQGLDDLEGRFSDSFTNGPYVWRLWTRFILTDLFSLRVFTNLKYRNYEVDSCCLKTKCCFICLCLFVFRKLRFFILLIIHNM